MKTFLDLVLAGDARQDDMTTLWIAGTMATRRVPWQRFLGCRTTNMRYGREAFFLKSHSPSTC